MQYQWGNKNKKLFDNILKVEENIEMLDNRAKDVERIDKNDKEEISLAIKDLSEVIETLHTKSSAKLKELKTSNEENSEFMMNGFNTLSNELKGFNAIFEDNKVEVQFCFTDFEKQKL